MNRTIIININSIVFHIEEDAYETLRSYMIEIKRHFSQSADSGEILLDIENRIAEMFSERIQLGKKEVISAQDVDEVIAQMGKVSDFEEFDDLSDESSTADKQDDKQDDSSRVFYEKKLLRSVDDVVIGGVCSGLGYYFGISTKWVRVLFVLFVLFGGSGVLLYVVLWAVMPVASTRADRMAMQGKEPNLQNFKKDFEEEVENYGAGFSKVQSEISKGVKSVGSSFSSIFVFFGKLLAFILLVVSGMVVVGMIITLVGFASAIFGLQSEMAFPGLDVLPQGQALIALVAGVLACTIPFLALFNILVRVLFKTRPMNNYLSLTLWSTWVTSVLLVVFFSFLGAREFQEDSTIKVDKPLALQQVYYFSEKDVRVIDGATLRNGLPNYPIKLDVDGEELSAFLKRDIHIKFEHVAENEAPYIQYNYYAKGRTYQAATKRALEIDYLAHQENEKIIFNSHFAIGKNNDYRDQAVSVVVYLPIGAKVVLDESLRYKLRGIGFSDCKINYEEDNVKSTEWIMKKSGLSCSPNFLPVETDDLSSDLEKANQEIEKAKEEIERSKKIIEENTKQIQRDASNLNN